MAVSASAAPEDVTARPESMHAAVLHAPGDLRYEVVRVPCPRAGRVLVRVAVAGHCGSDLPRIMVTGTYSLPTIPGHEFAGRVAQVAEDVDASWNGRRVAVIPLVPCGECEYCRVGWTYLCLRYDYLGSRSDGGFAEYAEVPVANLVPLPPELSDEDGAALEPVAVALHGIRRAGGVRPEDIVLVLGVGSVGAFALQWARVLGANRVFAVDVDDAKLDVARQLGADDVANPAHGDLLTAVMDVTRGLGATLVIEASGSPEAQRATISLVCKRGRVVFLGISHHDVVFSDEVIVRKEPALFGSFNYTFDVPDSDWDAALLAVAHGRVRVTPMVSHRLPLAEAPATYRAMHEGRFPHHKIFFLP